MKKFRFELILALVSLGAFAALWMWLTPGARTALTPADVEAYIGRIEPVIPMPADEKRELIARLRAWGEADDGAPVYMLNLMRYHEKLQPLPGIAASMSPLAANSHYENAVLPLLERVGGFPLMGGNVAGVGGAEGRRHSNLMVFERDVDDWDRVLMVRYPSRRAFFELISNPAYAELMPYKLAALRVALVPIKAEVVLPDPRLIVALGLVITVLATGWIRSASRRPRSQAPGR